MQRRLWSMVTLWLCCGVVWGFNAPEDSRHEVKVEILSIHNQMFEWGEPATFQVKVTNAGADEVAYELQVSLNDDWEVSDGRVSGKVAGQGGEAVHTFTGRPLERCESAHYPVHAVAKIRGKEAFELHAIAVFQVKARVRQATGGSAEVQPVLQGINMLALLPYVRKYVCLFPSMKELEFDGHSHVESRGMLYARDGNLLFHPPWNKVVEAGTGDGAGTGLVCVDYLLALPAGQPIRFESTAYIRQHTAKEPPSDGVEYRLEVTCDGKKQQLLKVFSDAKADLPLQADLSEYAGRTVRLTLSIGPGPANNTCCDGGTWRAPKVIVGERPQKHDTEYWQELEATAAAALAGKVSESSFRFVLGDGGVAAVALGRDGVLDGVIGFQCEDKKLFYRGLQMSVDHHRLGQEVSGRPVTVTGIERQGEQVTVRQLVRRAQGNVPFAVTFAPRGGTLTVRFAMPGVTRNLRGEPRFTQLMLGSSSDMPWRMYAGFGNVVEDCPKPWRIGGGGFKLSTRHVGCDYRQGMSMVQASDFFPHGVSFNPDEQRFSLEFRNDATLYLAPSTRGAYAAARKYAAVNGFKASPGLALALGRQCLDQWGGDYAQAEEDIRLAGLYGLNHSIFVKHVWQRWGYDYRLPEIYPPAEGLEPFRKLSDACREQGIVFAPHDNYIDFYPDAKGFSYDHIIYNSNGTPQRAWFNKGRKAQSYRWLPQAFRPWMVDNMKLIRDGIAPQGLFIDVFTCVAPFDYFDRSGKLHTSDRMAREWSAAFDTCRDILYPGGIMMSEAGHDGLVGSIDAVQSDHFTASHWGIEAKAMDRTPWHDIVSHGKMVLLAGGLGQRYGESNSDGFRSYGSDDYLSNTVLGGRNPMSQGPFHRIAVMTYWLLHDVCDFLARNSFDEHAFGPTVMQQHTVFAGGKGRVWANRGMSSWQPEGMSLKGTLPRFGFWVETPQAVAGVFENADGKRIGYARSQDEQGSQRIFADARPGNISSSRMGSRIVYQTKNVTVEKGRRILVDVEWQVKRPLGRTGKQMHFIHVCRSGAKQPEGIVFQGKVLKTDLDLEKPGIYRSTLAVEVPATVDDGEYEIRYGLYGKQGRVQLGGIDVDRERAMGGKFVHRRAAATPVVITDTTVNNENVEKSLALPLVDFGELQTNGAVRVIRSGADECQIVPLPNSLPFKVVLKLDKLGLGGRIVKGVECLHNQELGAQPEMTQQGDKVELKLDARSFGYRLQF